ncbi:MAG: amidohydrolase [Clostridiaceae bacterium]|nr:amidohydrolase [Clostridiaceae bacterium]
MIALKNCKAITISDGILDNAVILIEGGVIKAVEVKAEIPSDAEILDLEGMWVTPGFIDVHTHLSAMGEPRARGGGDDGNEVTGPVTAQVRIIDALNPFGIGIAAARMGGFTTCYTGPGSANVIGGTGIALKLKDGKCIEDIIIPGTEQMKMALGENPKGAYGSQKKMPMTRMGTGAVLREALFNAREYAQQLAEAEKTPEKPFKRDFKLEPLVPVVRGEMKARIHCHRADDILTAIRISEEFGLDYTIEHTTEGFKIADILAQKKVPCVVGPMLMIPGKMEVWECTIENPGILEKAGCEISITADAETATRWLPHEVGTAIAYGLSEEMAFRSLTVNPARILGIENRVGSLEPGKDADLAIFDGHPFSNMTRCKATMIEGVFCFNELGK